MFCCCCVWFGYSATKAKTGNKTKTEAQIFQHIFAPAFGQVKKARKDREGQGERGKKGRAGVVRGEVE